MSKEEREPLLSNSQNHQALNIECHQTYGSDTQQVYLVYLSLFSLHKENKIYWCCAIFYTLLYITALAVFYIFVIWGFIVACIRIKVVCTGSLLVKYWASLICRIFLSNLVAIYVYPFITKFNWLFACWIDWLLIYIVLYISESSSFGTTSPSGDTCRQQTTFFTICRFPKWPHKWRMWFWN